MTLEACKDPATRPNACRRIGEQLWINPETLRGWVVQAEIDEGQRPGVTTTEDLLPRPCLRSPPLETIHGSVLSGHDPKGGHSMTTPAGWQPDTQQPARLLGWRRLVGPSVGPP